MEESVCEEELETNGFDQQVGEEELETNEFEEPVCEEELEGNEFEEAVCEEELEGNEFEGPTCEEELEGNEFEEPTCEEELEQSINNDEFEANELERSVCADELDENFQENSTNNEETKNELEDNYSDGRKDFEKSYCETKLQENELETSLETKSIEDETLFNSSDEIKTEENVKSEGSLNESSSFQKSTKLKLHLNKNKKELKNILKAKRKKKKQDLISFSDDKNISRDKSPKHKLEKRIKEDIYKYKLTYSPPVYENRRQTRRKKSCYAELDINIEAFETDDVVAHSEVKKSRKGKRKSNKFDDFDSITSKQMKYDDAEESITDEFNEDKFSPEEADRLISDPLSDDNIPSLESSELLINEEDSNTSEKQKNKSRGRPKGKMRKNLAPKTEKRKSNIASPAKKVQRTKDMSGAEEVEDVNLVIMDNCNEQSNNSEINVNCYKGSNKCEQCNLHFLSLFELQRHLKTHKSNLSNNLCDDSKEPPTSSIQKQKNQNLNKKIDDKCSPSSVTTSSSSTTSTSSSLAAVKSPKKPRPIFKCPDCEQVFNRKCHLQLHQKKHEEENLLSCNQCELTFSSAFELQRHLLLHDTATEEQLTCRICTFSFKQEQQFEQHLRRHLETPHFTCDECGGFFTSLGSLKKHERYHSTYNPYSCSNCSASFPTSIALSRHYIVHNDLTYVLLKKINQQILDEKTRYSTLQQHQQTFVSDENRFNTSPQNQISENNISSSYPENYTCVSSCQSPLSLVIRKIKTDVTLDETINKKKPSYMSFQKKTPNNVKHSPLNKRNSMVQHTENKISRRLPNKKNKKSSSLQRRIFSKENQDVAKNKLDFKTISSGSNNTNVDLYCPNDCYDFTGSDTNMD